MEKDKQLMLLEGEQALVRVGVQMGLVDKILGEDEGLFLKQKMVLAQYYDEIECHGLILIQPNIYIKQKQVEVAILAFLKINFWYYLSKIMIMFRDKIIFVKNSMTI